MQHVADLAQVSRVLVHCIPRNLFHPLLSRMPRDPGEAYAPTFQMKKEQNVVGRQTSPGHHLDSEESGAGQDCHMRCDEILPGGMGLPLQSWRNAMAAQDVANGLIREFMPHVRERPNNPVVTPTGILSGHLNH